MVTYDFSGRVALVTGGTSGIGLATAVAFGRAGASVAVAARDEQAGQRACAAIEAHGARAMFVRTDVRDEADIARAVDYTVKRFGRLDCAVNSAGVGGNVAPLEATDQNDWDDVMRVNARGVWLSMRYQIPAMLASGAGAIVNLSSIYGMTGKPMLHAYVASKHAVLGMTRSVALEYAPRGVRVNAICAGLTRTPGVEASERAFPEIVQQLVAQHPMARMGSEREVAASALWLCSRDADYVTGTALSVDGGFLAA